MKKKTKKCTEKRTYKLEGGGGLEGFQTAVYLGCRVGRIYSACDA
jgi:hypothetical protein